MDKITLAIETSIKAGSLALLNGANVLDSWTGNNDISRSEDLLPQISRLLGENQVPPNQLQKIVVSVGPGSFTGIRIGISTAKGLAFALDCQLAGVSIFEALVFQATQTEKKTVVVSAGRDLYFWQSFQGAVATGNAATGNAALLENELDKDEKFIILAERIAYENLSRNEFKFLAETRFVNENYAELVGRCLVDAEGKFGEVVPLYIRPAVMIKQ